MRKYMLAIATAILATLPAMATAQTTMVATTGVSFHSFNDASDDAIDNVLDLCDGLNKILAFDWETDRYTRYFTRVRVYYVVQRGICIPCTDPYGTGACQ